MALKCNLKWNFASLSEWQGYFNQIRRSAITQSYDYARGVLPLYGQRPEWALIEIDGKPAGLIQIAQVSMLKGLIHAVILDLGPLWFDGYGSNDDFAAFMAAYSSCFPRRLGRKRRMIVSAQCDPQIHDIMKRHGWSQKGVVKDARHKTLWLYLTPEEEILRKSMRKSWRQSLTRAEKVDLELRWDETLKSLPLFLKRYQLDKAEKSYEGASVKMLASLGKSCAESGNLLIGTAFLDKSPIAGMLIFKHGCAATYQAAWSLPSARKCNAHHLILWQAVLKLKAAGIKDLDLGGINDTTAKSLRTFKAGIGAKEFVSAGLYI